MAVPWLRAGCISALLPASVPHLGNERSWRFFRIYGSLTVFGFPCYLWQHGCLVSTPLDSPSGYALCFGLPRTEVLGAQQERVVQLC